MSSEQPVIYLEEAWDETITKKALNPLEEMLEKGVDKKKKLFNNKEYIDIYSMLYNMCTQRPPHNYSEQLYTRHGETIYNYLNDKVLPALQTKHGEALLVELVKRGKNHMLMVKWLKLFFAYLDRYHVKYYSLPTLGESGLLKFKELIFDNVKESVTQAVLTLVNEERDGATVDQSLIKGAIDIYIEMGMERLDVYRTDFEDHYLQSSSDYYGQKAAIWLQNDSTPNYLIKAEKAFQDEKQRVLRYLNPETESKITETVTREVLSNQEDELLNKEGSGCRALMINDMKDDLARMYRMFSGIPDGLLPMALIFKAYIIECGNGKISERTSRLAALEAEGKKESAEDSEFVQALLKMHSRFFDLIQVCFDEAASFHRSLKEAFQEIVNKTTGKHGTADLVSSYCDSILKTSGVQMTEKELEETLDKLVQLISYLHDKDIFAEHYRGLFAKRLLNQRSASDQMERHIIGKLKTMQGAQYTAKLEGMLSDLSVGKKIAEDFKSCFAEKAASTGLSKMKFEVQVLTFGHWPTYPNPVVDIPNVLTRCQEIYRSFYAGHEGGGESKKLDWYHTLGNCDVSGRFAKGTYVLDVTPLQAIILMQFAEGPAKRAFGSIKDATKLEVEVLKRVLHSLSCGKFKILKKTEAEGNDADPKKAARKVFEDDSFEFNAGFQSKTRNFRVPMASLDDTGNVRKRVDEDRGQQIEACIVRVMKARKTLGHQQLVSEVLNQLQSFRPAPAMIKQKIEGLIERDYLERESGSSYKYLA